MKYIVYKTTNLANNYIYIGVHGTEDPDNFDGYLGNGVYIKNPRSYEKSKTCFQQAVKQFGCKNFRREVLAIYDTPEEAYLLEELLVNENFLSRSDVYNMIKGESTVKELIPVYRYTIDGKFDKAFNSLNEAGVDSGASATYIKKSAILGYSVKNTYYFSFYKFDTYDKARSVQILNRKVYQYDSNGNYLKEFDSQKEAELQNPNCNITNSIKLKTADKDGNYWALEKLPKYNVPVYHPAKKVGKYDDKGTLLQTWDSSNQCAKEVGPAVKNVLQGKYTHHKGFIYKYVNN